MRPRATTRAREAFVSLGWYLLLFPVSVYGLSRPGWPLPRNLSGEAFERALDNGVDLDPWKVLAFFGWLVWLCIVWSTGATVWHTLRRTERRGMLLPAAWQPLLVRLATGVLLLGAAGTSDHGSAAPPELVALVADRPLPVDGDATVTRPPPSSPPDTSAATRSAPASPTVLDAPYLRVRRGNSLSGISAALLRADVRSAEVKHLVQELVDLNAERPQGDGRRLVDPDLIETGWWLLLPERLGVEPGGWLLVEHGDSPWALAEECLGDPELRHDLLRLNVGRTQRDGRVLAHRDGYIYEGWLLQVPDSHVKPPVPTSDPVAGVSNRAAAETPASTVAPLVATPIPSLVPAPPVEPSSSTVVDDLDEEAARPPEPVVVLPSGSEVPLWFAAGVAAGLVLSRLRGRAAYRPRKPGPAPLGGTSRQPPTLARLERVARLGRASGDVHDESTSGTNWYAVDRCDAVPTRVEVGLSDGTPVMVDPVVLRCLVLTGDGGPAVLRAIVGQLLVGAEPGDVEVVADGACASALGFEQAFPGFRPLGSTSDALAWAEAELLHRARLLDGEEVGDFAAHRCSHPDDPLPGTVLVLAPPQSALPRLAAVLAIGERLGVGAVVLGGDVAEAGLAVEVGADHVVTTVRPEEYAVRPGLVLHHLDSQELHEVMALLASNRTGNVPVAHPRPESGPYEVEPGQHPVSPSIKQNGGDTGPVRIAVLGGFEIVGEVAEVRTGLRNKARELLALLLLRPGGVTADTAMDLLWPDVPPEVAIHRFRASVGNLRAVLREAAGRPEAKFVDRIREATFRADGVLFEVDLWRFLGALGRARSADNATAELAALRQATEAYGGELLACTDYPWTQIDREALHESALDALVRLAQLSADQGEVDHAIEALDRAAELDPYAEEVHRRLIGLLVETDQIDSARRTLRRLESRLDELGYEPSPETISLLRSSGPLG